jgi:hypothetical protein
VDAVSPALVATQGVELDATVTGANLGGVAVGGVTVSGAGVSVLSATPGADGPTLALAFAVDPAADLGTHALTLATPAGSAVLQLYVRQPPPTVTAVHPAAPTTRPSRKTTARSYSRRILSPLSANATRMAIAAHAPSIAAVIRALRERLDRRGTRTRAARRREKPPAA